MSGISVPDATRVLPVAVAGLALAAGALVGSVDLAVVAAVVAFFAAKTVESLLVAFRDLD
ncbi:MAG: hypothetical protein ABEI99_11885 [Halobaculum sp.]